jgi:hypothetical protein
MVKTLPMPRHIIATVVFAIAPLAACATPSASRRFDHDTLVNHGGDGLSHQEQEWLALGKPEDHGNVDHLGLGEPTAAAIIQDDLDFGPRAPGVNDAAANKAHDLARNDCRSQADQCSEVMELESFLDDQ